ncbi:substrate-binding periplasmic protein [Marinobacter mobilis]|uniref:Amino acid ABC transporter substrate-binding protein, PAAT family n=1 Tax=Marinobacter mobilis TaxID=488533 RepID=A0A1H2SWB2_9GAMM|nr:transporter substrate-binding domain-containing protein [Marinobacter mobilis]SDW35294.1 amino acid ABC transporter substrate-binding protein, PAAT family [Marinobacter mobilis]
MRYSFLSILTSACLLVVSALAASPGVADEISQNLTLTAALAEADYPPFYFRDDNQLVGFSIEVLDHVAKTVGVRVQYQRLSWPRVLQSLNDGRVDMVTTFSNTAERAPLVVYTGIPHAVERNHLFARNDSDVSYDGNIDSLAGYRIGAITGYSYGDDFDHASYLAVERVLDEPTLVRMVLGNRFDLAVGNPFAIRLEATKLGAAEHLRFLDPPVNRSPIYMAFSRKHPLALDLAAAFTAAILQFKATETYQGLLDKYDLRGAGFSE